MNVESLVTYPTWKKTLVLSRVIESLRVRDKRVIFQMIRNHSSIDHNTLLPAYGFTTGEFAVWQVLGDARKPRR